MLAWVKWKPPAGPIRPFVYKSGSIPGIDFVATGSYQQTGGCPVPPGLLWSFLRLRVSSPTSADALLLSSLLCLGPLRDTPGLPRLCSHLFPCSFCILPRFSGLSKAIDGNSCREVKKELSDLANPIHQKLTDGGAVASSSLAGKTAGGGRK